MDFITRDLSTPGGRTMFQYVMDWQVLVDKRKTRVVFGKLAILLAVIDDKPYAIIDKCPHMGFPISPGKLENGIIKCKEHGLEINIATGSVVDTPKATFLKLSPSDRSVRVFPVKIEDGKVFVDF
jgi:nitrite reductase/ring-hydroxylating ferredoxin subunit